MKILYLACHSILEYDELKIFEELGYDYFSIGGYINPQKPHDPKRPALKGAYHEHLASIAMVHNADNLHEKQVEWADIVVISHVPKWIDNNWELLKKSGKRIIWRSIGQSVSHIEQKLQIYRKDGLEIVRYSPAESNIPGYAGHDAIIRFYKDSEEFKGWEGLTDEIITFAQNMKGRGEFCNYDTFKDIAKSFKNAHIYGPNNEDTGFNGGMLDYPKLKAKMREAGVYVYTGTWPASYTLNFIEAWMTGIPIVAIGSSRGNSPIFNQDTYEVPDLITNGLHGFVSDDTEQMKIFIERLLKDKNFAHEIGKNGRIKAIELFGKDLIRKQWKAYLEHGKS